MPIVNKMFKFVNLFTKLKLKNLKTMELLKLSTEEFVNLDASQVKFVSHLVELLNTQCIYCFRSIRLVPSEGDYYVFLELNACGLTILNLIQAFIDTHFSFHPLCLSSDQVYFRI